MSTATKEHPILFSAPMVRAILSGDKTQTRRIVTSRNSTVCGYTDKHHWGQLIWDERVFVDPGFGEGEYLKVPAGSDGAMYRVRCRNVIGESFWVRESFKPAWVALPGVSGPGITYRADNKAIGRPEAIMYEHTDYHCSAKWRPSIHMPRWASRINLDITNVRVERLQDISEEDARAEGVDTLPSAPAALSHRTAFAGLWKSINEPGSWDANPWVWCYTFERADN